MVRRQQRRHPVAMIHAPRIALCILFILSMVGLQPQSLAASQSVETATTCGTTELDYTVEVCLTAPTPDTPLMEDTLISVTTSVTGDAHVRSIDFDIDGRRVLTDFDMPYQFTLPVAYWGTGTWELSATARMSGKEKTTPVGTTITIASGNPMTFTDTTFTPTTGRPAAPGEPFVVAAIGDSAGGSPESAAVADLIGSWNPNLLLYLGDVYNSGTYPEFMNWYNPDTFLGRFRDITLPTPGNHEYAGADRPRGYMEYWGNPPHYYSVDVAGWHIVSLDSNPKFSETAQNTEQMQWLEQDLTSSANACTVVFFHHPPHSVGNYAEEEGELDYLWRTLVNHDVTLILSGHDHNYQRWEPLNADGDPDPSGTVSLIVGSGGQSEYVAQKEDPRVAGPVLQVTGAMRLELNPNGAGMQFITTDGVVQDTSVAPCDTSAADTTPPDAPDGLVANRELDGVVTLRWNPATDDTGVDHYRIYRNDQVIEDANQGLVSIDSDAMSIADPVYRVEAVDSAGNTSPASDNVTPTGQTGTDIQFADSFSSGTLIRWETVDGLTVWQDPTNDGHGWVARARGSNHSASAVWAAPSSPDGDLSFTTSFRILEQGDNPIVFLRLRNPDGDSLGSVNIGTNGTLATYNDVESAGTNSSQAVSLDAWHTLTVSITGSPSDRTLTVVLDGATISELSGPIELGGRPIGAIQLGDSTNNRVYDVLYDDVVVGSAAPVFETTPAPEASPAARVTGNLPP